MAIFRQLAGSLGKGIDTVGNWITPNSGGTSWDGIDISSTLQNYGGNTSGTLRDAVVRPAQAYNVPQTQQIQNTSYQYDQPAGPAYPGDVLGVNTSRGSSNGSGGVSNQGGGIDTGSGVSGPLGPSDSPGGGQPSFLDLINNEYSAFDQSLSNYENRANQDFATLRQQTAADKAADLSNVAQQQEAQTAAVRDQKRLGLAEARQMLHDLSVRNNAQLAASGGGVNKEALADRFSRAANSSLGNIQRSAEQQFNNISNFYADKVNQLEKAYRDKVTEAQARLEQVKMQIASDRTQAQSDKVRQSYQAWADFYNTKRQLEAEAYSMKLQYDAWKEGKLKEVNDMAYQVQDLGYKDFIDQANQQARTGYAPAVDQAYGLPVGARRIDMNNQGEDEELLTDNFLQNAVLAG